MKRFSLILFAVLVCGSISAQKLSQAQMDKLMQWTPGLIKLSDCLPYYKANNCEAQLQKMPKDWQCGFSMGKRAKLGDILKFAYSVNSEYSAYDLPIVDNYAYRITYKDKDSNLVSAVSTTTLLFIKDRKGGEMSVYVRLSFVKNHDTDWVPALSKRTKRDYYEIYTLLSGKGKGVHRCYPEGVDGWTDLWIERAEHIDTFKKRPAPEVFYTGKGTEVKEIPLGMFACDHFDSDGNGVAECVLHYELGF
ncbi:MAG: hypothetical protein E7139_06080 [Rikenellaceae bacterium]|nr:hypothetical protein [Rikenellaceae bacterium]